MYMYSPSGINRRVRLQKLLAHVIAAAGADVHSQTILDGEERHPAPLPSTDKSNLSTETSLDIIIEL